MLSCLFRSITLLPLKKNIPVLPQTGQSCHKHQNNKNEARNLAKNGTAGETFEARGVGKVVLGKNTRNAWDIKGRLLPLNDIL